MKQDFQAGVDSIYNALVAAGATPGSKNPADIVGAINSGMSASNVQVLRFNDTVGDRIYVPLYITVKSSNRETHIINIIGSPGGNPTMNIDVTNYNIARIRYGVIRNGIGDTVKNPTINGMAVSGTGETTVNCVGANNLELRSGYTENSWAAFIIVSYVVELSNS